MKKLQSLLALDKLHVTEQADGSLYIVQETNDVRDTQQVVVLSAEQWHQIRAIRALYVKEGVMQDV